MIELIRALLAEGYALDCQNDGDDASGWERPAAEASYEAGWHDTLPVECAPYSDPDLGATDVTLFDRWLYEAEQVLRGCCQALPDASAETVWECMEAQEVALKPAGAGFRQGWQEAQAGETEPVSKLWE